MDQHDLLDLKERIEKSKTKIAELNGQKKLLLTQLKDNFECSDLVAAKKKLEQFNKDIDKLDTLIEKAVENVKDKYDLT